MKLDLNCSKQLNWRKFNFKCMTSLNLKLDTPNLIEEKVGNMLELTGRGRNFLDRTQFSAVIWIKN